MIEALYLSEAGTVQLLTTLEDIRAAHLTAQGKLWLHIANYSPEEAHTILHDLFNFHPLAIEDTLSTGYQPPKVDDFDSYLFIIVHAILNLEHSKTLETTEINCFLGQNYLVTACSETDLPALAQVRERTKRDCRLIERGLDFLLHAILDAIVDEYLPLLDQIDEEVDSLEDSIILNPKPQNLRRILELKHTILTLRRITSPQREVMLRLSRNEFTLIEERTLIYFRDIYDHLVRLNDLTENVRDVVTGAMDTYLSVSSNKLNEVMKALTIVSTIFLPLTLITSLYGMNFDVMPELHWRYGYLMVWVIMLAVISGMLWFFRRKRWL